MTAPPIGEHRAPSSTLRRTLRETWPYVHDYGSVDAAPVMEKVWAARAGLGYVGKNGCFITDGSHRFDDPTKPVTWQGFDSKGPTRLEDNVWLGANVVVTSGVTIGARSVIGANSVVTADLEPYTLAAGAPARVLRRIGTAGAAGESR